MSKGPRSVGSPPTEVMRSFQPVGIWQLHLVKGRISFRCVLCRQQQDKALWAATKVGGSVEKLACQPCYRAILREYYSMGPKSTDPKPNRKKPESDPLRRRLPGVDRLVSFFHSAGVAAELTRDGSLRVNGGQTRPLPQVLPPSGTFDWAEVIDEMTLRYASDKFMAAVAGNGRFGEGLRASLRPGRDGVRNHARQCPAGIDPSHSRVRAGSRRRCRELPYARLPLADSG